MSETPNTYISAFIERQFPEYFRNEGPDLVKFIVYYYEWLEQNGNLNNHLMKFNTYRDTFDTPEYFFEFLRSEFMNDIPTNNVVDDRLLLRNIIDFYKSKGDEKSYRLLFRILFNEKISFYYPTQDILRVDDGKWTIEKSLEIQLVNDYDIQSIEDIVVIKGETSLATARIDSIENNNNEYTCIYLTSIFGEFIQNENLINTVTNEIFGTVKSNGIISSSGRYLNTDGFLDSEKRLRDDFYYQEFSYEIKSSLPIQKYSNVVKKLVHPSGMKLFGKLVYEIPISLPLSLSINYSSLNNVIRISPYLIDLNIDDISFYLTLKDTLSNDLSADIISETFIIETLTGNLNLKNAQILNYSDPIEEYANVPINLFGTRQLIIGANTNFVGQNMANSTLLTIQDSGNSANDVYIAQKIYSNTTLKLSKNYNYSTLSNGLGVFRKIV